MAKDYGTGVKSKKKKQTKGKHKIFLITLILLIIIGFVAGLYFLKTKTKNTTIQVPVKSEKPKSVLPTLPEEVWSYIKALETRTVPVDNNQSLNNDIRLSEEQKKILLEMEKEQKAAEQARIKEDKGREKIDIVSAKPVQTAQSIQNNPTVNSPEKKFGLQCGAFKNRAQAENMQARLSIAGFDAKIKRSENWNRVVIGPIGDHNTTKTTLEKVNSIGNCVIIGM
ncbi:cell division protein FtsN [Histophilus somni]|uniref:SPOR domain-containing protein n=1 Tax=Histophilus somni TaxID=731 RepID=UPI000B3B40AC|nr:SPOR domain-containing protein [Histophilus somni]ARU66998.1 cell division protein FtsN [Histophilus somni]ARU68869.1 cell division protein FtsN [Histophilus somni]ARU70751.1 cell division protein FtsN [Histophilus somni]ARU72624.1 cell division protein FtsN [Histophilus somni]ARU75685.1 cell division protein FtsN [Histophilus somni]